MKMTLVLLLLLVTAIGCGKNQNDLGGKPETQRTTKDSLRSRDIPSSPKLINNVVCDKFDMKYNILDDILELSLDTDLPDDTILMVGVSRSYFKKGNDDEYSHDYFSEKSTIDKWKKTHMISVASDKWKASFRKKQKDFSKMTLGFQVASVSDTISIHMIVPINQINPNFGEDNKNLEGKAVRTKGLRVIEKEVELKLPLNDNEWEAKHVPSLDPSALDIGPTYVVSETTPLMPSHSPRDPIKALGQMKRIPQGGSFNILKIHNKKMDPWYEVTAKGGDGKPLGNGWINSTALIGQQLNVSE